MILRAIQRRSYFINVNDEFNHIQELERKWHLQLLDEDAFTTHRLAD